MAGQLDIAKEIAALAATVTVKEILAGIDIERRAGFRMKGTESDELGAVRGGPGGPTFVPQVSEQRKARVPFFRGLAHRGELAPEASGRDCCQPFQERRVGEGKFSNPQRRHR